MEHNPILKFELSVDLLVRLKQFARQRHQTVAAVLRDLIEEAITKKGTAHAKNSQ